METLEDFLGNPVELEARNDIANVRRRYGILAQRDLFGATIIETSWGKIGRRAKTKCISFCDDGQGASHKTGTDIR